MIMKSLEGDDTAQLKGGCNVAYAPGDVFANRAPISKVNKLLSMGGDILINLPMRITSYHFCYTDTRMIVLLSLIRQCFGKEIRMRMRVHYGTLFVVLIFHTPASFLFSRQISICMQRLKIPDSSSYFFLCRVRP